MIFLTKKSVKKTRKLVAKIPSDSETSESEDEVAVVLKAKPKKQTSK